MSPDSPPFVSPSFQTDQDLVNALIERKAQGLDPTIEWRAITPPSRQQRRFRGRELANGLLKQAHGASLKRNTRRRIARASARRNRR